MTEAPQSEKTTVERNDARSRYEISVDDVLAGFTEFTVDTHGRLVFPHTEIDPAFGGRGLAGTLVREAMTDVSSRGETVVPVCRFVQKFLRENEIAGLNVEWRDQEKTAEPRP